MVRSKMKGKVIGERERELARGGTEEGERARESFVSPPRQRGRGRERKRKAKGKADVVRASHYSLTLHRVVMCRWCATWYSITPFAPAFLRAPTRTLTPMIQIA
jgi:hypothetical protein